MSPGSRGFENDSPKIVGDADEPAAIVENHPVGRDRRRERAVGEAAFAQPTGPDPAMADDRGRYPQRPAHGDRGQDREVDRPDDPPAAPLGVPGAVESEVLRMPPGHVLSVAEESRRPDQAVRPGLVESDAIPRDEAVVDAWDRSIGGAGQPRVERLWAARGLEHREEPSAGSSAGANDRQAIEEDGHVPARPRPVVAR